MKGSVFDRNDTTIIVGRQKGRWKLFLNDPYISQKHARLYWEPEMEIWMVRDLGSSNGTFLNFIEVRDEGVIAKFNV